MINSLGGSQTFVAGGNHRLLADMSMVLTDPSWTWTWEAGIMAARAQELVANDPFSQAMVAAKLDNTHGPAGLRVKSLAYLTDSGVTTTAERALRRKVERIIDRSRGHTFSADGLLTRRQLMRQLDWCATVLGEGYLVRVLKDGAAHYTRWRLVRPERVSNPDNVPNNPRLYEGLELDASGEVIAIWVRTDVVGEWGSRNESKWQRIPIIAKDGTRNVIRRTGLLLPGMLRGVSMFAPLVLLVKQLQGTMEAHVTTKRAQACMPIITYTDDPDALKEAEENGTLLTPYATFAPLKVFYARLGTQVVLPTIDFKGDDYKAFVTTMYRVLTAAWAMPVEVVLCQMGEASLASARAGLDQLDRTAQTWQIDHVEQAEQPADRAAIAEGVASGELEPGEAGMDGLAAGTYRGPPKYSTDRKKDADTIGILVANDVSKTTALAMFGMDYEDEQEQKAQDAETEALHTTTATAPIQPVVEETPLDPPAEPAGDDSTPNDDGEPVGPDGEPVTSIQRKAA